MIAQGLLKKNKYEYPTVIYFYDNIPLFILFMITLVFTTIFVFMRFATKLVFTRFATMDRIFDPHPVCKPILIFTEI